MKTINLSYIFILYITYIIGGSRVEDRIFFKPWSQALSQAEMLV